MQLPKYSTRNEIRGEKSKASELSKIRCIRKRIEYMGWKCSLQSRHILSPIKIT